MFYVYVYLDPRHSEIHESDTVTFLYRPIYVGKGKGNRYKAHLRKNNDNPLFESRLKELRNLGKENIPIIKVFESDNEDACYAFEDELVTCLGRYNTGKGPLLNLVDGGKGGSCASDDGLRRISEANKGKPKSQEHRDKISSSLTGVEHTEEHRDKISNTLKGNVPWNKGKTGVYSEETLDKMRSKVFTDETRAKMSASQQGKVISNDTRAKMSETHTGTTKSEETKKRMSEARKAYWRKKKQESLDDS